MTAILFRIRRAVLLLGIFLLGISLNPTEASATSFLFTTAGVSGPYPEPITPASVLSGFLNPVLCAFGWHSVHLMPCLGTGLYN
jgi:hypothetical protein